MRTNFFKIWTIGYYKRSFTEVGISLTKNLKQETTNNKHPTKTKARRNYAPFMNYDLSKAIIRKSKTKNKYLNWPPRGNFISYKTTKNKCNSLTKKAHWDFFKEATKDGIMANKKFWRTVKPFLTNSDLISNGFIGIENEGNLICNLWNYLMNIT